MIDFGLAKRYRCPNSGQHIEHKQNRGVVGTTRYLSKNAHEGHEQSRKDDLIALGNILIMFMRQGDLPWDMVAIPDLQVDEKDPLIYKKTLEHNKATQKWEQDYLQLKLNTTILELTEGVQGPWLDYFTYVNSLHFEQKPDYEYIRSLFEQPFKEKLYTLDDQFDWVLHKRFLIE